MSDEDVRKVCAFKGCEIRPTEVVRTEGGEKLFDLCFRHAAEVVLAGAVSRYNESTRSYRDLGWG